MDERDRIVWAGRVETWECDSNNHLNLRFYLAKCMEAVASLATELGMPGAFSRNAEATLVVRDQHIRFLREVAPSNEISFSAGVLAMGETDARLLMIMRHLTGEPAAVFQLGVEHVTSREMRPFEWSARTRERAAAWSASTPPELAPRSLEAGSGASQASLARADALGLAQGALGVVTPDTCDIFGRMRAETVAAWMARGIRRTTQDLSQHDQARDVSTAVVEYRILHLDWPQAGDRVVQRTGLSGYDERTRRINHWLLDPDSGRAWASVQSVVVSFDLQTRKLVRVSDADKAAIDRIAVPQMSL